MSLQLHKDLAKAMDSSISVKAIIKGPLGTLVLKDAYSDYWDLPGGHVQDGEVLKDALIREVLEETGLNVTKVKEMRKREREVALKENGFWAGGLQMTHFNGIDPRLLLKYSDMVDSLTVEAVQAAARKYFDFGNYVRVTLLPEEGAGQEAAGGGD